MKQRTWSRLAARPFLLGATLQALLLSAMCQSVRAAEPPHTDPTHYAPPADMRRGGALAESYQYHRLGPAAVSALPHAAYQPSAGAYRYGFPVESYRWGWFGASHYYPRVIWHRGYNGEATRWAYRRGY